MALIPCYRPLVPLGVVALGCWFQRITKGHLHVFEPGGTKLLGSGSGPLRQTARRESSLSLTQGFGPTSHRQRQPGTTHPLTVPLPLPFTFLSPSQANAAIDRVGEQLCTFSCARS